MYKRERPSRDAPFVPQRRRTPSFSSTLLDEIYRSIDEPNGGGDPAAASVIKKQSKQTISSVSNRNKGVGGDAGYGGAAALEEQRDVCNLGRAVMIESWIEKQTTTTTTTTRSSIHYNSNSSSSDCSSRGGYGGCGGGGFFSSSEADSSTKDDSRRSSSFTPQRTKADKQQKKPSKCTEEGGFVKTKLRALKIYGELKKVKQPISPGGRIASFLNSIFSSGSAKKVKMCSSIGAAMEDVSSDRKSKSACSSVTSFSRSCLSKNTPPPPPPPSAPSRGKTGNVGKRTVRFYPVGVIVDEDSRPCGHKCIYENDPGLMPLPQKIVKSSSLKEDVTKAADYLRTYQKKNFSEFDFRGFHRYIEEDYSDDDEEDDDSCASSDLFELDHLIGIGRYREELPVYETTNFKKNQAIANGFIL